MFTVTEQLDRVKHMNDGPPRDFYLAAKAIQHLHKDRLKGLLSSCRNVPLPVREARRGFVFF